MTAIQAYMTGVITVCNLKTRITEAAVTFTATAFTIESFRGRLRIIQIHKADDFR
jgi:hypothetical protein